MAISRPAPTIGGVAEGAGEVVPEDQAQDRPAGFEHGEDQADAQPGGRVDAGHADADRGGKVGKPR